ncbi:MAG TPA: PQQ-dependent sugar dehydrogenase [Acidimicrobiia bacterium]
MGGNGSKRWWAIAAAAALTAGMVTSQAGASTAGNAASATSLGTRAAFSVQTAIAPSLVTGPVAIATASDGRIFVAEIGGVIEVFHGVTDTHPKVFADLSNEVYSAQGHGLLGMTLDPNFPTKPYVYVLYSRDSATRGGPIVTKKDTCATHATTGCVRYARLARLTAKGDTMVAGSLKVLVDDWCNQFVHHIGALHFGKDGMLYASGGDGATEQVNGVNGADYGQFGNACGDPPSPAGTNLTAPTAQGGSLRAQDILAGYNTDPVTLDGTIIRVNPTTGAAAAGNPYSSATDPNQKRIVGWGFRNPFRFAIRPGTNDIYASDPGLDTYEEIDRIPSPTTKAPDFGWPCWEGTIQQPEFKAANLNMCNSLYAAHSDTKPLFEYADAGHVVSSSDGCPATSGTAATGLTFYTGTSYPAAYKGALFFSDYGRACLFAAPAGASGAPNFAARKVVTTLPAAGIVDIEPGPNGDLLLVNINNSTIYELHYS